MSFPFFFFSSFASSSVLSFLLLAIRDVASAHSTYAIPSRFIRLSLLLLSSHPSLHSSFEIRLLLYCYQCASVEPYNS